MNYIITIAGVVLKGILSVLLKITGPTETSDAVTKGINFIMIGCIVIGIVIASQRYKGKELAKVLAIQALIAVAGFFATKFLVWILIILGAVIFLVIGSALTPRSYDQKIMYNGQNINVRKIDENTYEDPEGNIYTIDD